jgi:hypothetical protein
VPPAYPQADQSRCREDGGSRREKFEKEHQELLKTAEPNKELKLFWVTNGR